MTVGVHALTPIVFNGGELDCQLAEIDENLCRANLTPTQEAEHLARRKEIWEAMQASSGTTCSTGGGGAPGENKGFAAETAATTGQSKQDVNRKTRRATEVCQEARDLIRGTKLDTGTFLDRPAKELGRSPPERT